MPAMPDDHQPPVDPDVDLGDEAQGPSRGDRSTLAAIAVGGVIGAEARYGLSVVLPHTPSQFPWSTLVTNTAGCLLLAVLIAVVVERRPHRLIRPFLGVGVLGGFTTFSTFALDVHSLVRADRPTVGLLYAALTLVAGVTATWAGGRVSRRRLAGRR